METTNPITGEIYNLTSDEDLKEAYDLMKKMKVRLKIFEEQVKQGMMQKLGNNESTTLSAVYELKAVKRITSSYPISMLKKHFDEDQLMECMKPINKQVDSMLGILSKEAQNEIKGSMIVIGQSVSYKIM